MVSERSGKPIRASPRLRNIRNMAFEIAPMLVWLAMALSGPFKIDRDTRLVDGFLSSAYEDILGGCVVLCSLWYFPTSNVANLRALVFTLVQSPSHSHFVVSSTGRKLYPEFDRPSTSC